MKHKKAETQLADMKGKLEAMKDQLLVQKNKVKDAEKHLTKVKEQTDNAQQTLDQVGIKTRY